MVVDEGSSLTTGRAFVAIDVETFASSLGGAFGDDAVVALTRTNQHTTIVISTSQNPDSTTLPTAPD